MPTHKSIIKALEAEKKGLITKKAAADEDGAKVIDARLSAVDKSLAHATKQDKAKKHFATVPAPAKRTR